ncbi:MFS transporter [Jidongwangia harbinensis]|uniref:MFS transporter n=1 Tax=Jidongwangia harbinensis TaxID=2878561 RepID=UPI001CD9EB39|nr:MFS transporter [Jidongwangia harbinensis]MCA2215962.1 MFS transporter [Jidongwangia harbinensis]
MTFQELPAPRTRSPRAVVTLAVATLGLGLNLRASILLGPHLHGRFKVGLGAYAVLVGLPLLVAALVRLPVGVLTDRYGARVMFPAVSLAAAGAVIASGLAGSLPAVIVAGAAAGLAGSAFVVGAALVSRTQPYGRRGRALGTFGLGVTVAMGLSGMSRGLDPGGRLGALVLGGLLVGFAVLAAVVLRDPVGTRRTTSVARTCAEMIRVSGSTSLSLLYLLALGGMVSIAVFLPVYLVAAFGTEWFTALAITGVVVGLAAAGRLAGGWWTDRRPTARLLMFCYGAAAVLCLAGALLPRAWWLMAPVIAGIAVCDGIASGALLALIGKSARADHVGAVMGVTGAAASLGALLPPLLLTGVTGLTGSYSVAWLLLAALLLAAALYVRAHDLHIGLGLAVRFEPEPSPTAMTIALVGEADTLLGAAAVVARLAELATSDELVVVYGADERARTRTGPQAIAAGLRGRLPRHSVVAVRVGRDTAELGRDALELGEYVDAGALAIAVTPTAQMSMVAADLSLYLQADRVLRVSYTPAEGAALRPL